MRPIKFRAWDKESEVMFYSRDDNFCCVKADRPDKEYGVIMVGALDVIAKTMPLMQFTGLKDKNGKEIYEGDIIKATWSDSSEEIRPDLWTYGIIRFGEGEVDASDYEDYSITVIGFYIEYIKGCDYTPLSILHYENLIVIGNIHENPELLEEEK